ncbi:PREDICTED: homeobox-leucine zipper protein HDG5-like isoform X4 [Camelina sativa]|uniref:Homeobox-leucine zipper protein HDG5-like isoform X1 n=1 Tax=Camelina sativa TaxID=90675 RepID=A0ABM0Y3J7_CAMSA|nr:PREDICTED: homeobox-leucine zipper protein HDG5-like isoform X1 [Camelina sativa]XP_010494886.1 PREDICTED: homeobox-leucine zipper protein HDG5-like isoform X2 [Camelina sativa]XP_010494890.1 PREDICTED: homeobox-leucine zipper protein HDG5-like isoform X3 [Camelina sativa]XP_010494891.1 PREDICTED: homeobox-leucine zipper protein HDG5-like isoform X4 [Camelina sativa]
MLSIGEGNVMTSDNMRFASQQPSSSSPGTIQNPNFNFIPFNSFSSIIPKEEHGMMSMMMMMGDGTVEEMMENGSAGGSFGSGSEQAEDPKFGNESDVNELQDDEQPPPAKKKRYHRHTNRQIQEMEALFKENPHPDDKQRKRLSAELGLKPRQVKFWFQNRRTQMKAQQDRTENAMLRAENANLKSENCHLQGELRCLSCPSCGGPTVLGDIPFNELHIENCRLREELDRICCITSRYTGRPMQSMPSSQPLIDPSSTLPHHQPSLELDMSVYAGNFPEHSCADMMMLPSQDTTCFFPDQTVNNNNNNMLLAEEEKVIAMEIAVSCVQELTKMCDAEEPLWIKKKSDKISGEILCLNEEEYMRLFPWPVENHNNKADFAREASKANSVVIMNSITLVDAFLNADKWSEMFCSIVARAKTVQIISSGVSGASGSLLLMYAEFQVLSPLVPTREAYFLRYVEQNAENGNWAIVDFPIDSFHDQMQPPSTNSPHEYKRKPSGCIIQDMPNGYSQVKWVEHVEVDEKHVHETFAEYVKSGMAFGANRWLDVLQRQCERIASLMARNITDLGVISSAEARRNMMRLSQRMVRTFCVNISTAYGQSWTALSETSKDTVRITTRKMCEPGQPTGVLLSAVSTTWLPFTHHQVFDLIRDQHHQSLLEVLFNGNSPHEVAHIANGSHPGNCISLLRINVASNSWHNVELMLQESSIDNSGSLIVYSTVDVDSIQLAMNGEDSSNIPILPLGFSIVPVNPPEGISVNSNSPPSCLLTVAIQVLASNVPTAKPNLSTVTTINNHLCATVNQITSALTSSVTPAIASSAAVSKQEAS